MNAWMNEWTDEWLSESMNFADPIFQKCSETLRLLTIFFCEIELSLQSRAHITDLVFQKCSKPVSFLRFYVKPSSRQSLVHIFPNPSSKRGLNASVFQHFHATVLCRSRPQPRKQRPYFGDHGSHFTGKNAEFRAQECFQAWIHALPTCYTSQLLDGDVVDLMMWLTWWWECCPWQSRKFSN